MKRLKGGVSLFLTPACWSAPVTSERGIFQEPQRHQVPVPVRSVSSLDHPQAMGSGPEANSVSSSKGLPLLLPLCHFLHLSSAAVSDPRDARLQKEGFS